MSFFARVEAVCAEAVERAFAVAFPSALEPVQIARKLVAAFESGAAASGRGGRRFVVRLNPADYARFATDRSYLERQWSAMLAHLAERSGRPQRRPEVCAESDASVAGGTVAVSVEALPEAERLALRVRKGLPQDARVVLDRTLILGRDASSDLVLLDPRVSRRHVEVALEAGRWHFRDLGSANGTRQNGARTPAGELGLGDVLGLGDTELLVEPDDAALPA